MRLSLATTVILSAAEQASLVQGLGRISPKSIIDVSKPYRYQSRVEDIVRRDAHVILNHALYHQRNVIPSPTDADLAAEVVSPPSKSAASDQSSTWDKDTEAACKEALSKANDSPPNPTGVMACYNIRSFNNTAGTFQSELRLYRMSPPTGDWASMNPGSTSVTLACSGASLDMSKTKNRKRADEMLSWPPVRKATRKALTLRQSDPPSPQKLEDMTFDGKVHDDQMGNMKNTASARNLLIPTITFSGTAKDDKYVTTTVSSKDASFVHGMFADDVQTKASSSPSTSSPSPNPNPSSSGRPAAAATNQVFVLPGKTLGIFPVGFVITGVWALLFVIIVGAGTVDRIRFREAYRRRVKREKTIGLRMI